MGEQGPPYFGPSHNQPPYYRDDWDCHNCGKPFYTELERDCHVRLCMQNVPGLFVSDNIVCVSQILCQL